MPTGPDASDVMRFNGRMGKLRRWAGDSRRDDVVDVVDAVGCAHRVGG